MKCKPIPTTCNFCGETFDFLEGASALARRKTHCCSSRCAGALKRSGQRTLACGYCHKTFIYKGRLAQLELDTVRCCSLACASHFRHVTHGKAGTPEHNLWLNAKRRSSKNGIEFRLTIHDIPAIPEKCPVLGILLEHGKGTGGAIHGSPSLDRIVPSLGYIPGNVRVISHRANLLRSNATAMELMMVAHDAVRLEADVISAIDDGSLLLPSPKHLSFDRQIGDAIGLS